MFKKKMCALFLTVLLLASLTVPALALPIRSPTLGDKPVVKAVSEKFLDEDGKIVNPEDPDCKVVLAVTQYQEKDNNPSGDLDREEKTVIKDGLETAYHSYRKDYSADARELLMDMPSSEHGNWAMVYPTSELYLVNLFDVTIKCQLDDHNSTHVHYNHTVSLELSEEDASNFIGLICYQDLDHNYADTSDANWVEIPVKRVGNTITFTLTCGDSAPFALVAREKTGSHHDHDDDHDSDEPVSPQTGNQSYGYWMTGSLFFAAAGVTVLYKGKKRA